MMEKEFSVHDLITGIAYPEDEVTIAIDIVAGKELTRLYEERLDSADDEHLHEERLKELLEQIESTAITFELRGMKPGKVSDILDKGIFKEGDEDKSNEEITHEVLDVRYNELTAQTIIGARNRNGDRDDTPVTADVIALYRQHLAEGEFMKLSEAVNKVNINANAFASTVDAGFLSRGTDEAS